MPLSKVKDKERKRLAKIRLENKSVIPKLPFYAGADNHFGEVRNENYARQFFSNLFQPK